MEIPESILRFRHDPAQLRAQLQKEPRELLIALAGSDKYSDEVLLEKSAEYIDTPGFAFLGEDIEYGCLNTGFDLPTHSSYEDLTAHDLLTLREVSPEWYEEAFEPEMPINQWLFNKTRSESLNLNEIGLPGEISKADYKRVYSTLNWDWHNDKVVIVKRPYKYMVRGVTDVTHFYNETAKAHLKKNIGVSTSRVPAPPEGVYNLSDIDHLTLKDAVLTLDHFKLLTSEKYLPTLEKKMAQESNSTWTGLNNHYFPYLQAKFYNSNIFKSKEDNYLDNFDEVKKLIPQGYIGGRHGTSAEKQEEILDEYNDLLELLNGEEPSLPTKITSINDLTSYAKILMQINEKYTRRSDITDNDDDRDIAFISYSLLTAVLNDYETRLIDIGKLGEVKQYKYTPYDVEANQQYRTCLKKLIDQDHLEINNHLLTLPESYDLVLKSDKSYSKDFIKYGLFLAYLDEYYTRSNTHMNSRFIFTLDDWNNIRSHFDLNGITREKIVTLLQECFAYPFVPPDRNILQARTFRTRMINDITINNEMRLKPYVATSGKTIVYNLNGSALTRRFILANYTPNDVDIRISYQDEQDVYVTDADFDEAVQNFAERNILTNITKVVLSNNKYKYSADGKLNKQTNQFVNTQNASLDDIKHKLDDSLKLLNQETNQQITINDLKNPSRWTGAQLDLLKTLDSYWSAIELLDELNDFQTEEGLNVKVELYRASFGFISNYHVPPVRVNMTQSENGNYLVSFYPSGLISLITGICVDLRYFTSEKGNPMQIVERYWDRTFTFFLNNTELTLYVLYLTGQALKGKNLSDIGYIYKETYDYLKDNFSVEDQEIFDTIVNEGLSNSQFPVELVDVFKFNKSIEILDQIKKLQRNRFWLKMLTDTNHLPVPKWV